MGQIKIGVDRKRAPNKVSDRHHDRSQQDYLAGSRPDRTYQFHMRDGRVLIVSEAEFERIGREELKLREAAWKMLTTDVPVGNKEVEALPKGKRGRVTKQ